MVYTFYTNIFIKNTNLCPGQRPTGQVYYIYILCSRLKNYEFVF